MKSVLDVRSPGDGSIHPRRMLDRYEILAEIAQGGMGTVYLARLGGAGGFERLFAIKLMHEHLAREETFVAMLLDEARTAAHIHHPNAVGIIDVRESPVGYYLVMNYVDGFSLAHMLGTRPVEPTARIRAATRLIADAAHGLHAAHSAKNMKGERLGIVHRDVSPQNILVGTDGVGRIVDFGIALAASRVVASRPGVLKGKPSYMSPEQARGEPCDARADVFALGIVLWEALTGQRLFYADMDIATLVKVMECRVEPPTKHVPNLPDALSAVVMKALQREPADRFASARDFAVALERAAESAGLLASAHEIEELVASLFADEIAIRQAAISRRLADTRGPAQPLDRAGLAAISRLIPKPGGAVEPQSDPQLPATRASRGGSDVRSGVRPSRPSGDLRTPSSPIDLDRDHRDHASIRPEAITPKRPRRWMTAAIVIAIAAIGGAVAALAGSSGTGVTEASASEIADPAPPLAPAIVAPVTPPAPAVAPVAPPSVVTAPAVLPAAARGPIPSGVDVPTEREPARARRRAPQAPTTPEPERSPRPSAPELEANPYFSR